MREKIGVDDEFVGNVADHRDPITNWRYNHFSLEETRGPLQALVSNVGDV